MFVICMIAGDLVESFKFTVSDMLNIKVAYFNIFFFCDLSSAC